MSDEEGESGEDPNDLVVCPKLVSSRVRMELNSKYTLRHVGPDISNTLAHHKASSLQYPESCHSEDKLLETLVDARSRYFDTKINALGLDIQHFAQLFVHAILAYSKCSALNCDRSHDSSFKSPGAQAANSAQGACTSKPGHGTRSSQGRLAGKQRGCGRDRMKSYSVSTSFVLDTGGNAWQFVPPSVEDSRSTASPRLKINLAPFVFLRRAVCRNTVWRAAPPGIMGT